MVYVDSLLNLGWRWGMSCHLIADSEEELHAFAEGIGLKRIWFQPKSSPHYDLTASKRLAAIMAGAIELDRREFVGKIKELRAKARKQSDAQP